ncbi:MAG: BspA family leucine-rich repeat surface protein, partial [Desulfobacterales bacterium]|nr:BspA family leucine-rich repeat surface protein [Desulfobacterales bacterium]
DVFNGDISAWDTSSVTNMSYMFNSADAFDQDIGLWDTSKVENMSYMFGSADAFNQDISGWDTSKVEDMSYMLDNAIAFNQDIGGWDISDVTTMASMLDNTNLSISNYDATLTGWAAQTVQSGVTLGASGLQYSLSIADRQSLIDDDGWTIIGDSFVANTVPVAANSTVLTNEDTTYTLVAADFGYSDGDGHAMASVKITTLETVGSLQLSGVDVTLNQVITRADIDAGNLKFVPAGDANGSGYDNFSFSVNDGAADSVSTYTMTVDVTAVNDAPSFSTIGDGIGTDPIGTGDESGEQIVIQADGKMVVGGYTWNGSDYDFAVTRYNTDGSLDSSFGTGGTVVTAVTAGDDYLLGLALQADGKILATGYDHNGSEYEYIVVRYDTDGNLDTDFDGDGIVITDPSASGGGRARAITVQDDGQIVVIGNSAGGQNDFTVIRYNANGSLDTGFGGGDGIAATDLFSAGNHDYAMSVAIQADGKILLGGARLGGASSYDFVLARYDTDGTLDTGFGGGNGYVMTEVGGDDQSYSTVVQADGKIVLIGWTDNDIALVRYNSDGTLDTDYGTGGKVISDLSGNTDKGYAAALQTDGKIVVAGYSNNGVDNDFMLARYDTDGNLDTSFGGGDGFTTTAIGSGDDIAWSLALQADGKIVLAGQSHNDTDYDFAYARYNSDGTLDTSFDSVYLNTLDGAPTFTEGGAAVVLDGDVEIRDVELDALNSGNGNYDGASVTLVRNGGASSEDVFSESGTLSALTESGNLVVGATTIGTVTTNSGGTLVLTFNSNATSALVDSTLQSIAYSNNSDDPPASVQIDWTFDDGNTGSQGTGGALQALGSTTVTITATNDDPTNAGTLPTDIMVTTDVSSNVDLSAIDLSDVDAAGGSLTVTLTTSTGGNLSAAAGTGITIGGTSTARTLTGTLTDLNNYLDTASNITYLHGTPGTNGDNADTINVKVNDNGNTGTGGGTDIDLGTVNVDIVSPEATALATGFVTTWQTDNPGTSADDTITIPIGSGTTDF